MALRFGQQQGANCASFSLCQEQISRYPPSTYMRSVGRGPHQSNNHKAVFARPRGITQILSSANGKLVL